MAVLTEDKRLRAQEEAGEGTHYSRTYYGPLNPTALAALLPTFGGSMPSGSDCPAGTLVIGISPARQAPGRAVSMVTVTGLKRRTGAVA